MIDHLPRARPRDPLPVLAATVVTAITAAPWALGFSASHAAVAGHSAFAPIALLINALPAAAVTTGAAGAWLVTSPWALGYASLGAMAWSADLIAGLILVALAVRARSAGDQHAGPSARRGPRA